MIPVPSLTDKVWQELDLVPAEIQQAQILGHQTGAKASEKIMQVCFFRPSYIS